jgi:hypothetical protein
MPLVNVILFFPIRVINFIFMALSVNASVRF